MVADPFQPEANGIRPLTLANWEEAKRELNRLGPNWIFRGQSDATWPLKTSLERCVETHAMLAPREWETEMIEQLRRAAHHYLRPGEIPDSDDKMEWLALMQHHGAPTRLLDFTRSPYVASFFALSEASGSSAVWAIDARWCRTAAQNYVDSYNAADDEREPVMWPSREARRDIWSSDHIESLLSRDLAVAVSLEPFRKNERLNIQRGVFMISGDLSRPFMDVFTRFGGGELAEHVRKFVFDEAVREKAIPDLNRMNINRASLFPGLDGYAGSLRLYPFVYQEEAPYR